MGVLDGIGFSIGGGQSALGPSPPTGTSGVGIPSGRPLMVAKAASQYGVPLWVMVGVFGMETTWGTNVNTSSAGAAGDFQFIPSTAQLYHYPMTNIPSDSQFQQQADSAANYLSVLYHQNGKSWDAALHAYSGGGYGEAQVKSKAGQAPGPYKALLGATGFTNVGGPIGGVTQAVGSGVDATANALGSIAKILSFLFSKQFLYILGGGALLLLAIYLIARETGTAPKISKLAEMTAE